MLEIRRFVAALQRFKVGQSPITVILAVFAPQPRWRHKPWKGLFCIVLFIFILYESEVRQ